MVKPERYKVNQLSKRKIFPKEIQTLTSQLLVEELERKSNGSWYAVTRVTLRFEFADGRAVTVQRTIRLRGAQEGKRPNPNLFGRGKSDGSKKPSRRNS